MIEALILDELERLRAQTNKSAIQSVDYDFLFRGAATSVNTPGQFMLAADPTTFPVSTTPESWNTNHYTGYIGNVRATYYSAVEGQRPYYAKILKRWFFGKQGVAGSTMWSYDPATNSFTAEDATRKLVHVIEDTFGVIWAVSFDTTFRGVYRRTGAGAWTQVLSDELGGNGVYCADDGTPYFLNSTNQWFKPSGTTLITTTSPGASAAWLQDGITGNEYTSNSPMHLAWNALKQGSNFALISAYRLRKAVSGTVVATAPIELFEQLRKMPRTTAGNEKSHQVWVKVADTPYWLYVVTYCPLIYTNGTAMLSPLDLRNRSFVGIVNTATGQSQYLGEISVGVPRVRDLGAGTAATTMGFAYDDYPTLSPLMASISGGKLRLVYAGPVPFIDTNGGIPQTDFAMVRANIDALITI